MSLFIELLQVSLGTRNDMSCVPTDVEWSQIYIEAQRQAIVGVLAGGLERLSEEQRPPKNLLLQWLGLVQMNELAYKLQCQRAKELTSLFQDAGYASSVLKGVGMAQFYPVPSRRPCGDIDLWVNGQRKEIVRWLRDRYIIGNVIWHHVDAEIFDDVPTEIHYHPCWVYNPFYNKRVQRFFEREKTKQMKVFESLGFAYPSAEFNAIYALVHTFHHLIEEGVGLRHIIDCYYIVTALIAESKAKVVGQLKELGLYRLASAVMWVLVEVCGMRDTELLCKANEKEGRFLYDEIMRGGNFGHHRKDDRKRNTVTRYIALLPHYTNEVLWVLPWKIWHRSWMILHRNG